MNQVNLSRVAVGFILGIAIMSTSKILNMGFGYFDSLWPGVVGACTMTYFMIIAHAERHSNLVKKGVWPTHWKENLLIRIPVGIAISCLINAYHFHWVSVLDMFLMLCFYFGVIFNFSYNDKMGHHPFYIGKDDHKDSLIDTIFSKLGPDGGVYLFILELAGFAICARLYMLQE